MIRLLLNRTIAGNYVFCDPEARVHLSIGQPGGNALKLTQSIIRALKGKTVIDVDGVVDLEKGIIKVAIAEKAEQPPSPIQDNTPKTIPPVETPAEDKKEEVPPVEEKKKSTRTTKSK